MAFPLVPPPASDTGAYNNPRQLQRWLDVNPATRLTRTYAYITLPSFNVTNVQWNGYSDIIASFNYEGPNNFVLTGFNIEPSPTPNYCLCVSWRTSTTVYRYALWTGVGEKFYFPIVPYSGQKIGKNFRFEIWSTNNSTIGQSTSINIYTSVLGGVDYRYGSDFVLVSNDIINTSFGDSIVSGGTVQPALHNYFNLTMPGASSSFVVGSPSVWNDMLQINSISGTARFGSDSKTVINTSLHSISAWDVVNFAPTLFAFSVSQPSTINYLQFNIGGLVGISPQTNYEIQVNNTTVLFTLIANSTTYSFTYSNTTGILYVSGVVSNTGICTINAYDINGTILGTMTFALGQTSFIDFAHSSFALGLLSGTYYQICFSSSLTSDATVIPYLVSQNGYSLPLTFPSTSVSTVN